jgi:acyl phosphate:glycerol-3-phosphate acyltransferase
MNEAAWAIAVVLAYLIGAVPFGLLIGRLHGVDLRNIGSGNIGATNCGRVLGRKWGLVCFALDLLKGFVPVFAAGWWFGLVGGAGSASRAAEWAWLGVAVAAVLGHIFPVWLGFRGGKGVATGLGVVLGVWPYLTIPALGAAATWMLYAGTFRYVGLASVVASLLLPAYVLVGAWATGSPADRTAPYLAISGGMALLIIVRHRSNLQRTWTGTEPRLGDRYGPQTPKNFS